MQLRPFVISKLPNHEGRAKKNLGHFVKVATIRAVAELQPGCATAASRTATINSLRLHYFEWGEPGRTPLLFLHGGSAHAHWFDAVAPAFADRYHAVALDQRGHGESEWSRPPAYATEDFARDLRGVIEALGWRQAVVIGHSMGGHNAMAFAAWHPEHVRALVVVDSRPAIPEERLKQLRARGYRALRLHRTRQDAIAAFHLLPRETRADAGILSHLATMGVVERDGGFMYRFDPEANRSRRPVDTMRLLEGITAPTLVVRGEWSPVLTREMADRMVATIRGARFAEIPATYHHLVLDAPVAFVRVLGDFLSTL